MSQWRLKQHLHQFGRLLLPLFVLNNPAACRSNLPSEFLVQWDRDTWKEALLKGAADDVLGVWGRVADTEEAPQQTGPLNEAVGAWGALKQMLKAGPAREGQRGRAADTEARTGEG